MLEVRRDEDIHEADGGWFRARWHFSFDRYYDPDHMGVGALRVFNDDRIVGGAVWPMHPHRDIESLTYVVEGTFSHADSLGNGGVLEPGAAQVMTFSHEGAQHSERNGSDTEPMRFIQFWVLPSEEGLADSVQQAQYTIDDRTDRWLTIMSPQGEPGLDLHQDARVVVSRLTSGASLAHDVADGRGAYLYVIDGAIQLGDEKLGTRDAAAIQGPEAVDITATATAELILVDVPLDFEPVGMWRSHR